MPNELEKLKITPEIRDLVDNALATGNPMLLAVVTEDGQPLLSFRGSIQTYSDDQIGIWARKAEGNTLTAIRHNPNVAMIYRSPTTPVLQFHGRARVAKDPAERDAVFENAPEREQQADPDRHGAAVIVDLDRIEGVLRHGPDGLVFCRMARSPD